MSFKTIASDAAQRSAQTGADPINIIANDGARRAGRSGRMARVEGTELAQNDEPLLSRAKAALLIPSGSELAGEQSSDAEGIKANLANAEAVRNMSAPARLPVINLPQSKTSTSDLINTGARSRYGSRPGERRLDSEGNELIPSYDEGTDFVPEDQLAFIHRGEKITPAYENMVEGMKPLAPADKPAGMPRVQMDPNSTEPATISTQELGITKPKELISTEEKPEATGGTALADSWLKRNGMEKDVTVPSALQRPKIPGLNPIVLPPDKNAPMISEPLTGKAAYQAKVADYDKQYQDLMDKAEQTNDPAAREQAARVKDAKLAYQQAHSWGTPESAHPGVLGKLGHIGEMIASRAPFGIGTIAATIPGSEGYRAAQARGAEGQVKEASASRLQDAEAAEKTEETKEKENPQGKYLHTYVGADDKQHDVFQTANGIQDVVAGPALKENDPKQGAYDYLLHGGPNNSPLTDPETKQPYNPSTAYQRVQTYGQKPEKPVEDFATFYPKWLKDHPNAKDNSYSEALALKAFHEASQAPPQVMLLQPDAQGGQKAIVVKPGTTVSPEAVKPGEEAKINASTQKTFDTDYKKPATNVEKSYDMMDHAYQEYEDARAKGKDLPTGAQSMVALSTHLSTTFGNVKGARITKDMIQEHLGARGVSDKALVAFQKLSNGDVLSPDQWEAFHSLISESRTLSWQAAVKEAERKHVPINFLPDDLTAVKVPGHSASTIHASQLQDFQKKYPNGVVLSEKE